MERVTHCKPLELCLVLMEIQDRLFLHGNDKYRNIVFYFSPAQDDFYIL